MPRRQRRGLYGDPFSSSRVSSRLWIGRSCRFGIGEGHSLWGGAAPVKGAQHAIDVEGDGAGRTMSPHGSEVSTAFRRLLIHPSKPPPLAFTAPGP